MRFLPSHSESERVGGEKRPIKRKTEHWDEMTGKNRRMTLRPLEMKVSWSNHLRWTCECLHYNATKHPSMTSQIILRIFFPFFPIQFLLFVLPEISFSGKAMFQIPIMQGVGLLSDPLCAIVVLSLFFKTEKTTSWSIEEIKIDAALRYRFEVFD